MTAMIRKQIYITAELQAELKQMSQATGESEAELVRQALANYLQASSKASRLRAWQNERGFIKSHMEQNPVPNARSWTREELYRG